MTNFTFILKENSEKQYRSFFWFLFFLHVTAICLLLSSSYNNSHFLYDLSFLVIYGAFILFYYYFKNKKYIFTKYIFLIGIVYAIFWIRYVGYGAGIISTLVIIIAEILHVRKNIVIFSDEDIRIKSVLFIKKYVWSDVDNVILKDNLLTIDFKSNKLFQIEIVEENTNVIEEFNAFALNKINQKL